MELTGLGDSLPSIISTTIAMIVLSAMTLFVARKSGVGEIQSAVAEANQRLTDTQAERISLLEKKVEELEAEVEKRDVIIAKQEKRIDALEKIVSDEQLRRLLHKVDVE